jgi:hypothetical protein
VKAKRSWVNQHKALYLRKQVRQEWRVRPGCGPSVNHRHGLVASAVGSEELDLREQKLALAPVVDSLLVAFAVGLVLHPRVIRGEDALQHAFAHFFPHGRVLRQVEVSLNDTVPVSLADHLNGRGDESDKGKAILGWGQDGAAAHALVFATWANHCHTVAVAEVVDEIWGAARVSLHRVPQWPAAVLTL